MWFAEARRVKPLLIGDFTRTSSNDERRGQERLNCKVLVRYKWFAKFMIRKFRWVFPVFSSNLMFLRRVVPLFFQMAEQRPWCWVQGPWHESCEFSSELASINVVFSSTCHVYRLLIKDITRLAATTNREARSLTLVVLAATTNWETRSLTLLMR